MYTIKHAAAKTGVPEATLRAWERRYDLVSPQRTDGGYRVYSDTDLRRIREVVALIDRGYAPSQAAREVRQGAPAADAPRLTATEQEAAGAPFADTGGDDDATERLVTAAVAIDPAAIGAVLDEQFATSSFEHVVDRWLLPMLVEVGHAWAQGRLDVAGEHVVAHAVHRRLAAAFDAARVGGGTPRVIVGLPAGVHHELGLLAFSVALRRAGADVIHLGRDVPAAAWRATLDAHDAAAVVTAAPMVEDVSAAQSLVAELARSHSGVTPVVGGDQQAAVAGQGVLRPGHAIGPAATRVAQVVRAG